MTANFEKSASLGHLILGRSSSNELIPMAVQRMYEHPQGSNFDVGPPAAYVFSFVDHLSQPVRFLHSRTLSQRTLRPPSSLT